MSPPLVHGMSHTPEYMAWTDMKRRCYVKHRREYKNYGARGITVCERWLDSFANFFADMGPMPGLRYTVERKNVDGDYTPENCIWLLHAEQSQNRRMVKIQRHQWPEVVAFYEANGNGLTATAAHFGVCKTTIQNTIAKHRKAMAQ